MTEEHCRRIRLDLAYDGTDFAGWQFQPQQRTVEGVLRQALEQMWRTDVMVRTAGRTDAGVHAAHQVVAVETSSEMRPIQIQRGLNSLLPDDVRVFGCRQVEAGWDPRRAYSRQYRYRLTTGPVPDPLRRRYVHHVFQKLDVLAMDDAATYCEGMHDFSAFRSSGCDAEDARRRMFTCRVVREGDEIHFNIEGWAFLRHMVRIMMGTLIEIGQALRPPEDMAQLLDEGDRQQAGQTAPAQGLTLMQIKYEPELTG